MKLTHSFGHTKPFRYMLYFVQAMGSSEIVINARNFGF